MSSEEENRQVAFYERYEAMYGNMPEDDYQDIDLYNERVRQVRKSLGWE